MNAHTNTAANLTALPGYRADTADAPLLANERDYVKGSGLAYTLHACHVCGADYLRAHGVRGRKRESCSTECKNLGGTLRAAQTLLDRIADHNGTTDHHMSALRSDVWALVNNRAYAGAVHRNSTAVKAAAAVILDALTAEPLAADAILNLPALATYPRPVRSDALARLTKAGAIKSFRTLGIRAYRAA